MVAAVCESALWELACDPVSVGRGRRLVAEQVARWGVVEGDPAAPRVPDLLLAVSELLGNAIRFCRSPIRLSVRAHGGELRVEVTDDHPGLAVVREPGLLDEGGRGLRLVEAVTDGWGQDRRAATGGKTVWCSVEVATASVLRRRCDCDGARPAPGRD